MEKKDHIALILRALGNSRGDDLERARAAFRYLSPQEMSEQYGASGMTRAQLLAEYEADRAKHDAAIAWVRTL